MFRKVFVAAAAAVALVAIPQPAQPQPPAKEKERSNSWLSPGLLNKGYSLLAKAQGFRLIDVHLDFRPHFDHLIKVEHATVNLGGQGAGSNSSDKLDELLKQKAAVDAQLVQVEQERNKLLQEQNAILRDQLKLTQQQLDVQIEQAKLTREQLELERGAFRYQRTRDQALLRRDEYASVLRPGKLVVVVADFSSGGSSEGQEVADEVANALAELRKVAGIDVEVLVGELKPGVAIRSEQLARDVGQSFPKGTCYAVVWGTLSPRTVGKFRPHVTCVFKTDDDRGVSTTYTMDLDAQELPLAEDPETLRRARHEQLIGFTCAVVPGCYAAYEVARERIPDLTRFVNFVGPDTDFAKALQKELQPLVVWPQTRSKLNLGYVTRMSPVSPEATFPQVIMNSRDTSLMTLITEPGTTRPQRFREKDGSEYVTYIDIHETTWRQYLPFVNERGNQVDGAAPWLKVEPEFSNVLTDPAGKFTLRAPADAYYPVLNVSYFGARKYCQSVGKELPRREEWQAAARAAGKGNYPWGTAPGDPGLLCAGKAAAVRDGKQTRPVGSFAATDRSAIGCLDMAGNVSEWCEEFADKSESRRVVCGGSFADDQPKQFEITYTQELDQVTHHRTVGFRGVVRIKVSP